MSATPATGPEAPSDATAAPADAVPRQAAPGRSRLGSPLIARTDPAAPSPRERLLEAMAESIREHGFRGTTVADVVRRARTSRRTFYEYFDDREACFLQLFDAMNDVLSARIAAALVPGAPWEEQVDRAVAVYIDEVSVEQELTMACVREMPALGEAGVARQREELERFADLLMALATAMGMQEPEVTPMQRSTAIMITGGLRELVVYAADHDVDPADLKLAASGVIKAVLGPPRGGSTA